MFTDPDLKTKDLKAPPVRGCKCTYCNNFRLYGYGVAGHASMPSHRLGGGKEAHNPENLARLVLKKTVKPAAFKEYTSKPGGHVLWIKGQSGLWYATGRVADHHMAGHFVSVYPAANSSYEEGEYIATLCLPLQDGHAPLAAIVLAHYFALTYAEVVAWRTAAVDTITESEIPLELLDACSNPIEEEEEEVYDPDE